MECVSRGLLSILWQRMGPGCFDVPRFEIAFDLSAIPQEGGLCLTKVERRVVADGAWYEVACAVLADGETSPAAELLDELEAGMWADPEAAELPDERQVRDSIRLLALAESLANEGDLPRGLYNRLEKGIWELKVGNIRVTFYDTDGEGGFVPKYGTQVPAWDGYRWELPDDFDDFIRLGHTFAKTGKTTTRGDLARSETVRAEDVNHDKA